MKIILHRLWHTLLALLKFCWKYIAQPLYTFGKRKSVAYYQLHKHRLTAPYWQHKYRQVQTYNWRKAKVSDFSFFFKGVLRLSLIFVLVFFLFYLATYIGFFGSLPSRNDLKARQNNTASEVYSADSVLLGRYYIQDRTNVKYQDIAPHAVEALIATEDARFYEHAGVDHRSLLRVFFKSILFQKESSGGGSTLSQQLAKNLYPRKHYWFFSTPINKFREFIIARRLEKVYSKQEILELYLNTVPMGGDLYGIERASRRFFNTSADSLKIEEAAVLIGMLKATTTYNPRLNLEKSRTRRNVVLNQMVKYGYLSPEKASTLKEKPIRLEYRYQTHNDGLAPYFREQLRLELVKWCADQKKPDGTSYNLYTDGLRIYTTLDSKMQQLAEQAVRRRIARLQNQFDAHWRGRTPWGSNQEVIKTAMRASDRYKKLKAAGLSEGEIETEFAEPVSMQVFSWNKSSKKEMSPLDSIRYYQKFLNAGLIAIEPYTGFVKAWVGGINHHVFKYDHVRSKRQVGSTFKPIVYAAALEQGMDPCTPFPNQRMTYANYDNWSPRNADGKYGGEYTMRDALAHSVNTVSAQIIMKAGIEPTVSLAHRLGIKSTLPKVPALALGTANLSLFEMVQAYMTLANFGYRLNPTYITKIVNNKGEAIRQFSPDMNPKQVLAPEHAATIVHLLKGVVDEGSARRLRSEFGLAMDIAGKTGTTQNHSDGWFIGITPGLVTGVWVGAENPLVRFRTLNLGQGSNTALPIWGEFISKVVRTPKFASYRYTRFRPLPPDVEAKLTCNSFLEPEPQVVQASFLDRLLNHLPGRGNHREEDRGWGARRDRDRYEREEKDRWKEEEKWQEEREKKQEEENKKKWEDDRKWREERGKKLEERLKKWRKEGRKWRDN
ncbi:penicillin-binding protein 1A [Adhaeribacter aquaticus]|uniref:penicillin-binding protein 1A n=1 Tax=Adhaeribacter aquaticus TaxID=299567 RepID=UPI00040EACF0|nr:transglycosylase domain-containing protein [Adhaeribacter aquaticus]